MGEIPTESEIPFDSLSIILETSEKLCSKVNEFVFALGRVSKFPFRTVILIILSARLSHAQSTLNSFAQNANVTCSGRSVSENIVRSPK